MRKEEGNPSDKSTNEHKISFSQVTKCLRWIWDLERIWSFELYLGMNARALVLDVIFRKLGCQRMWWLGSIYSPQPLCSRWPRLLATGTPDSLVRHRTSTVRCPVRRHASQPLGFRAGRPLETLYSCGTGQSGALWLLRTDFWLALFIVAGAFAVDHWRMRAIALLAHRTVQWHIGQSGEL
jgi:hypothetical protein